MSHYRMIKDLRIDADKTQTEVASHLGTTAQYYGKYENGEREIPFYRAIELADFYNVSLDYLAERTKCKKKTIKTDITDEEIEIIKQYRELTERSKGRFDILLQRLIKKQLKETEKFNK